MSSVIRLDFSVDLFFLLLTHATLGEDTILTRAATITAQIGASRVASIHTRGSAPVHTHVMVRVRCQMPRCDCTYVQGCGEKSYGTNTSFRKLD